MPKLPPGPRSSVLQSFRYVRDAYGFYRDLQARYGDPFTVPTLNGTLVVTGHPEGIKQIFGSPAETFAEWRVGVIEPFLGPGSVFLQAGAVHAARRRLMMPMFHGERLHAYGQLFREVALRQAARLPQGEMASMGGLAEGVTLEAIGRTLVC
ncbi:MAG: cytochrome P450, partial [Candidatus Sericytochromatia bacterium]|nr:cytochrome P450 [Candidatus Sericytochromatia bacterium]